MFKLALIQMHVAGGRQSENLNRAVRMIGDSKAQGADIVLLPEMMDFGWTHPSARLQAGEIPGGKTFQTLQKAARDYGMYICAGLAERAGDRIYNSAVLLSGEGELLLLHRKINELPIARDCYDCGDRLQVCQTKFGTVGLMICADAFVENLAISRSLGEMGAEIILSPCSWAVPPDHDNVKEPYGSLWERVYTPVAIEFGLWIAGCSNVGEVEAGPWAGRRCIGRSQVVSPGGERVIFGPYGAEAEAILYIDIPERVARNSVSSGE